MSLQPLPQFVAVEAAERDRRQFDLEAARMAQKAIDEDLAGVAQADPFRRLVQGAGQDDAPETVDGALRLTVALEPFEERRVGIARGSPNAEQSPGDTQFLGGGEVVGARETAQEVEGR